MVVSSRVWVMGLLVAGVVAAAPAVDTIQGTASMDGASATFAHGFGIWYEERHAAAVGLFSAPLSEAAELTARQNKIRDASEDAYIVVKLNFPKKEKKATSVTVCEVDFYNFQGGMHQFIETSASGCGLTELTGELRAGGVLHGKLNISAEDDARRPHSWNLEFTTTLRTPD